MGGLIKLVREQPSVLTILCHDIVAYMRKSLIIRDVSDDDMGAIQEIYADEVINGVSSWEEKPPSLEEMIARRNCLIAAGYPYRVAELDQQITGFSYVSSYRSRVSYRYTVENTIYIDKNHRGHGTGRRLLKDLIERCEAQGYRQMVAVIGDSGNQASINFHRQMGFNEAGIIHSIGFKFGRWMDSVIMQKSLGKGDRTLP